MTSSRACVVAGAVALSVVASAARAADPVILWQNGFESADTCAWTTTVPAVTCDPEMVFVPAGDFPMGSNSGTPDQQPVHDVTLSAYWFDRNDVTVDAYAACESATACTAPDGSYSYDPACNWGAPNRGAHPINCVDWTQAAAYCAWAGNGRRLPTEAEWEKAARGTDARTYPWGDATPTCDHAVMSDPNADGTGCGLGTTWPVGSKGSGASPYGALDMAGNVYQWVSDWYDPNYYSVSPPTDPQGPATGSSTILRGGSWLNTVHLFATYRRVIGDRSTWDDSAGFRCARDACLEQGGTDDCSGSGLTNHQITVGQGYSDVSPHQIVRTTANVLYTVAASCSSYPDCPDNVIHVFEGNQPGTPTAFVEADAAHAPGTSVGAVSVAIDGANQIHVLYNQKTGSAIYAVFDTTTDTWVSSETLGATGWTDFTQGQEGTALAVDASGVPHAIFTTRTGPNNAVRLKYTQRLSTGWVAPIDVADQVDCNPPDSDYCGAWHPTLAFTPSGDLLLAWLNSVGDYVPDGRIRVRKRTAAGAWSASVAIPDDAMSGLDNGPSMIVTADGVAHITFDNTDNEIRYWYDAGAGWLGDQQPPSQVTHDPSLGVDLSNTLHIFGHGTPQGDVGGHGENMYFFSKPSGGAWGSWTLYASGSVDSSVSTRWSQFFHFHPENMDILYWADAYPNVLLVGVN